MTNYESAFGTVEFDDTTSFHNEAFGYTLFEEIVDPASPEGPRAIGMHVPAHSLSKVWELVEPGYSEHIELLSGEASLVVGKPNEDEWTTIPVTAENPTGDDLEISCGNVFCLVTDEQEAVVLSRPSKPFHISYEIGLTGGPTDALSQFVLTCVASKEG